MKAVRRFLSILLVVCMLASTLPMAFAAVPFHDVKPSDWYYSAVEYVYDNGLMSGTSSTTFSPNTTTTRGMIVTILHRLEKSPSASGEAFTDVPAGQYYSAAVAWASSNNIVSGYGNGRFGPNDAITREQMAAILYRYAQYKGRSTSTAANITTFSDHTKISSYATTAIRWAVAEGLTSGVGNNQLSPSGSATRAQVATILMRFQNASSSSTPQQNQTINNTSVLAFENFYGTWTINNEITQNKNGKTVLSLFGSAYTQYGSELKILENGTFSYYIGAGIGGSGTWNYQNQVFTYNVTAYEDGHHETGVITMKEDRSGMLYLCLDYYGIEACWTKSLFSSATTSAQISGIIFEEGSTALLPDVSVSLYDSARSHLLYSTKTYQNGMFEFEMTETGVFDLLFQKNGYQDIIFNDFEFKGNNHEFELGMVSISIPANPGGSAIPSTQPSQYSRSVYHNVIANANGKIGQYGMANGLFLDIDQNGIEELLLVYDTSSHSLPYPVPYRVWSLFTYENGIVKTLKEEDPLFVVAGGPSFNIGIVSYNGIPYLASNSETGETGSSPYGIDRAGTWNLYTLQNSTLKRNTTIEYWYTDYEGTISSDESGCKINGNGCTWSEYEQWVNSLSFTGTTISNNSAGYTFDQLLNMTQ